MLNDGKAMEHGWKDYPRGGVIPLPESVDVKTGSWRTMIPVITPAKCIDCMLCWAVCPDNAILPDNGKFGVFNYYHCKGCGICAQQCPVKAIDMKIEAETPKESIPKAKNLD